jgi:hypothetical protein
MLSAEDLDAMTPNERVTAFRERLITNPDDLPEHIRRRVFETAREPAARRSPQSPLPADDPPNG